MNSKTIGSVVAGLLIGLAAGYLVWGRGDKPTPPAPRGEWPMVPCPPNGMPPGMAVQALDEITSLAMAVAPMAEVVQYCAVHAQSIKSATPADENAASQHVHSARMAARTGDWEGCRRELDLVED